MFVAGVGLSKDCAKYRPVRLLHDIDRGSARWFPSLMTFVGLFFVLL